MQVEVADIGRAARELMDEVPRNELGTKDRILTAALQLAVEGDEILENRAACHRILDAMFQVKDAALSEGGEA